MDGIDRISELPEPILQHILSFLLVKDAIRTSILSKVWNNAWTSLSSLDFGAEHFPHSKDIVDQILVNRKNHKISIQRFRVRYSTDYSTDCSTSRVFDDWIKLLVACNIRELFLGATPLCYNRFNNLSRAIFAAKALNVLRVDGFKLKLPSKGIRFSSLKELRIQKSFLNENVLQALCESCSYLEVLSLIQFHGPTGLQVAGNLPKLRQVELKLCPPKFSVVDIVAHKLRELYIWSFSRKIDVIEITACKSLEILHLNGAAVTDEWVEQIFSCLLNLNVCHLIACSSLKIVKISSDRLKHLETSDCDSLSLVDLNTPNLLRFSCQVQYRKEGLSSNVDPSPTFKLKASHLQEVVLCLTPDTLDANWYSKLTECLSNFNNSRFIELGYNRNEVITIPKDMRLNLLPPLHGTKCLHVNIHSRLHHSVVDVVDSLLWTSPQLDTLYFGQTRDLKTLKFIYMDGAAFEDDKPCCTSLPLKCWRHKLEKVKLQNFEGAELQKLRSYFFANADNVEIIEVPPECSKLIVSNGLLQ